MSVETSMPPAVLKYLEELELQLKQVPGISPEEALSDAREFLLQDAEALDRSGEAPEESEHYRWIVEKYGDASKVAQQYAVNGPPVAARSGYAPGWRICCTKCGRSAPLAAIGGIRIGAKSVHKYTLGYCKDCRGFRFLRIIQDLDTPNLTHRLGLHQTPDQMRSQMHRPVATLVAILGTVGLILLMTFAIAIVFLIATKNARGQDLGSNQTAVERLSDSIRLNYSYSDLRGIDWNDRISQSKSEMVSARSPTEFASAAANCLKQAKDIHIWFKVEDKTIGTHQHAASVNFNPRVLPKLLPQWKQHGKTVIIGTTKDGFKYVLISTWDHREPDSMAAAMAAVRDASKDGMSLIIDVRPNSGGDELQARKVAAYFVDKPTPYAAHSIRQDGKDLPKQERLFGPSQDGIRHSGKCVVLMGPVNMSSCDSFLKMMRAAGIPLVGQASLGTSGNPKPHDLGNGVIIYLPSWKELDLKGDIAEGKGVQPDVLIETNQSSFQSADPVFEKACELLKKQR
ncbi:MAG: S41 family peptidase [Pirellula sp.]